MTNPLSHAHRQPGGREREWLGFALLALAALFVYGPVLRGSWVWDDPGEILERPEFRHWSGFWQIWTHPASPDYLPLKSTVQWLACRVWGESPMGFHLLTLTFHLANAALFWRVLTRLQTPGAWWGGLLFMVHPLTVESVAWISELKNTLSLAPLLLSFLAYLDFVESGKRGNYVKALGFFIAALLCKGSVVMYPCVLLGYAWWKKGRLDFPDTFRAMPFFAASLLSGLITIWFQQHRAIAGATSETSSLVMRTARAGWATIFYAKKSLFPVGLMPVYPSPNFAPETFASWIPSAVLLLAVGLTTVFVRTGFRGRTIFFAVSFFLTSLLPIVGLLDMYYLRISPVADHFAYLSILGPIALAAAGWGVLLSRAGPRRRSGLSALGGALCLALAIKSRAEAATFHDERTLWTQAVAGNPTSWLARHNLGQAIFQTGNAHEAIAQWQKALALSPDSALTHNDLGMAWSQLGDKTKARGEFEQALTLSPQLPDAQTNLGLLLLDEGNLEGASEHLTKAAKTSPTAERYVNLGSVYGRAGRYPEAIDAFIEASRLDPDSLAARLNRAQALVQINRPAEAIEQYQAAIELQPECGEAYLGIGNVFAVAGKTSEAATFYKEALRQQPNLEAARKNLSAIEGRR